MKSIFALIVLGKHKDSPRFRIRIFHKLIRKLWILSTIDRLFFPLIFYELYLTIGELKKRTAVNRVNFSLQ